ncbi:MAG: FtsQ-type POTRA domain-containing protein [Gemmatimonadota bacterium]
MPSFRLKKGWYVLGALALGATIWFGMPRLLRQMSFFRIRRVELVGLEHLHAEEVLRALKIPQRISVFDDASAIERRARALPGIHEATVVRRWPGTLRITLQETEPIALVPQGLLLRLEDQSGRILPFDPTLDPPDLPVAREPDSLVTGLLARVRSVEPTLFSRVSTAWRVQDDIVLNADGQRFRLRPDAAAEAIRAVMIVSQDRIRRGHRNDELDGRFAGQVIVRRGGA